MKFLAFVFGLGLATAQTTKTSLASLIKNSRPVNTQDDSIVLPIIQQPQKSVEGQGVENDFSAELQDGFLPCNGKDSCGEAANFNNEKDFSDFVIKYTPQISPTIRYAKIPQMMMADSGNIAQPMAMRNGAQSFMQSASFKGSIDYMPARAPSAPQPAQGRDYSGTNNQVTNVDEADLLKTDGTYIYSLSNRILSIVLAYPADRASVISKIDLKDLNAAALFIQGDYLSIFGTDYSTGNAFTFIKIYDVKNRAKPYLARTFKVAGSYQNGRKTDNGFVYLITNQSIYRNVRPWYDFGLGTSHLPFNLIYRYPITYVRPQLTNIVSFNLRNPLNSERKVVSVCGQSSNIMYMSQRSIYLTSNSYVNGQDYTTIRKIFVWRKNIIPFADGKIRGSINNQFSLDQYGPYLRVAATLNNAGSTTNSVYSLGFYLQPYGKLTGIAPSQRIFSARYVNTKLYLVTFRQIDPFFVISFANHRKPKILGQLKVPGFSRYLHPYDQDTIIGLGRQTDQAGRQLGLKVGLFDVSDCSSPQQIANLQIEEKFASSTAEWQHKAFLFSAEKNLMVIPTTMNDSVNKFNGALAIHISKQDKKIQIKAAIDHLKKQTDNFYQRNVERSLYIEQLLYTKSKCLLRINNINQEYSDVKDITLPCNEVQVSPILYNPLPIKLPPIRPKPIPIPIDDPIVSFDHAILGNRRYAV